MTFHDQWHLFKFDASHHARVSGGFACLGNHPSLANHTGATIKGVVAKFQNCSSKLCSVFGRFESISQRLLHKNFNFGTATSYHGLSWSQIETVQSPKMKL